MHKGRLRCTECGKVVDLSVFLSLWEPNSYGPCPQCGAISWQQVGEEKKDGKGSKRRREEHRTGNVE